MAEHFVKANSSALSLFLALALYAVFGSPTPDSFGIIEAAVGFLLFAAFGLSSFEQLFKKKYQELWVLYGWILLLYGITVPVVMAVISGVSLNEILRDILPFLFLLLPIFISLERKSSAPFYWAAITGSVSIGMIFSIRSVMPGNESLLYLENMPTVLFAGLFLFGLSLSCFIERNLNILKLSQSILLMFVALVPFAAMALTTQRASLGAALIYFVLICGIFVYRQPYKILSLIILMLIVVFCLFEQIDHFVQPLLEKTRYVGLNMRPQEFAAVWKVVSKDIIAFLFGTGWGATFSSPAVGGLHVHFTHNFFSSMLLKAGLFGVIFSFIYIIGLARLLLKVVRKNPVLGLSIAAPMVIDLTLYASYKSLDFGVILMLIPLSCCVGMDKEDKGGDEALPNNTQKSCSV